MNAYLNAKAPPLLPAGWFLNQSGLDGETCQTWAAQRPHLFSNTRVWVSQTDLEAMAAGIAALERVLLDKRYLTSVGLSDLPDGVQNVPGILFGYDFHLTPDGPKLIEINTNAGGAFLTANLGEAWAVLDTDHLPLTPVKTELQAMLAAEFGCPTDYPPSDRRLVIVDQDPAAQYLYPEFVLCQQWLQALGWQVVIAAPEALCWDGQQLMVEGLPVRGVYNRLTDFDFSELSSHALRAAYLAGAVVVSPHPANHARMAEKGHLVRLADGDFLAALGIADADRKAIASVLLPCARVVPEHAESLWQNRKNSFFKPVAGYGSKATYRGDKLTRRVFDEILAGQYIVQQMAPPPEQRVILPDGAEVDLKFDVRCYTYQAKVLGVVARLYQGQTTNFRTPGGGFAPVYSVV